MASLRIALAEEAIARAASVGAGLICFPGYRALNRAVPPPDATFLGHAHAILAPAAARENITVILGTERLVETSLRATALVINPHPRHRPSYLRSRSPYLGHRHLPRRLALPGNRPLGRPPTGPNGVPFPLP